MQSPQLLQRPITFVCKQQSYTVPLSYNNTFQPILESVSATAARCNKSFIWQGYSSNIHRHVCAIPPTGKFCSGKSSTEIALFSLERFLKTGLKRIISLNSIVQQGVTSHHKGGLIFISLPLYKCC